MKFMCNNANCAKSKDPIIVKDEGIIVTYKDPSTGEEYSVLGELAYEDKEIPRYKAIIYWSKEISLVKQVAILKKICPLVNEIPNGELMKNIKSTSEWEFGEFLPEEAEELIAKAKQNRLNMSRIQLE